MVQDHPHHPHHVRTIRTIHHRVTRQHAAFVVLLSTTRILVSSLDLDSISANGRHLYGTFFPSVIMRLFVNIRQKRRVEI